MKFNLTITKDILRRSAMCGNNSSVAKSCAFALAFNELVPNTVVGDEDTFFCRGEGGNIYLAMVQNTTLQTDFIGKFDKSTPEERMAMPEQTFEVEIPSEVIDHYYSSHVEVAQKLINNPVLQLINQ